MNLQASARHLVSVLLLITAPLMAVADEGQTQAARWRSQQLATVASRMEQAETDEQRLEFAARQSWLRRWSPGEMPSAPESAPDESELVMEPLLKGMERPANISKENWQRLTSLQSSLHAVDTDDERKENLRQIIPLAKKYERELTTALTDEQLRFPSTTGWVLAHARYRLGRALAYRELPTVREAWPIADPILYEQHLIAAHDSLLKLTGESRTEFILLDDRMLRRSGAKGRALELLEANKAFIDPKWYLKKRRDLLQELGWDPPFREAATHFIQAGYVD
ncbi:hypothetical protein [Rhodopirellula halodulae]|uniref:hypothetical protein n=1 Tax=Rhodopirellula halodulae TaxID=2894198 RepID=UPI001E59B230|nr:hypothetical protein [Rhodopirellula sp. JC737]MCC9654506.1 hypothetical protein [Rhodopirellula sp. JC737]